MKWGTELEEKPAANDDGSTADEASTLYEAIDRLAPYVPMELMDPDLVRDHIKLKFAAARAHPKRFMVTADGCWLPVSLLTRTPPLNKPLTQTPTLDTLDAPDTLDTLDTQDILDTF